ncbi:helix-turn-helix domain-containing protein [Nonomuraea sp. NN258]|uniref:helix-turn-helix domain-containing protein n=1 Tax=Nonomuraea antri TaxID=2730852 RepID=UPI001567D0C2|nr:helix-turn-helix transcriptional regulator [Nonomuraea antri]NRQ30930.1 helix-turn-helix domain-containing protein [Nonomuraea antri]
MENAEPEPALKAPSVEFGVHLREYRIMAGKRQKELAVMLGWSVSKISMLERGERRADEEFARAADTALEAGGGLLTRWRETVEHAGRFSIWLAQLVEIEQRADMLRGWEPLIIPGMLQTEQYARAIFRGRPGITPDLVEQSVAARMDRQCILERENGPTLWVVLDEGVLTRPIGSEEVMAEQLAKLTAMDDHPRVHLHVLPHDAWLTTGLQGAFMLAGGPEMPDTAYIESITLSQITAEPSRVLDVKSRYEMLHGEALPRRASLQLIEEKAKRWK